MNNVMSMERRNFLRLAGAGALAVGIGSRKGMAAEKPIQGFEQVAADKEASKGWKPVSDRKIRVGIAGNGVLEEGEEQMLHRVFGFANVIEIAFRSGVEFAGLGKVSK